MHYDIELQMQILAFIAAVILKNPDCDIGELFQGLH